MGLEKGQKQCSMSYWSFEAWKAGDRPLKDQTVEKSLPVTWKYTENKFKMVTLYMVICSVN